MFHLYRNQPVSMPCKSINWFLIKSFILRSIVAKKTRISDALDHVMKALYFRTKKMRNKKISNKICS